MLRYIVSQVIIMGKEGRSKFLPKAAALVGIGGALIAACGPEQPERVGSSVKVTAPATGRSETPSSPTATKSPDACPSPTTPLKDVDNLATGKGFVVALKPNQVVIQQYYVPAGANYVGIDRILGASLYIRKGTDVKKGEVLRELLRAKKAKPTDVYLRGITTRFGGFVDGVCYPKK